MSLFFSEDEKSLVKAVRKEEPYLSFYWALLNRVDKRAASPGLVNTESDAEWWHFAAEYLTDAAMAYALKPSDRLAAWLRDVTRSIAERPKDDWFGPFFRSRDDKPPVGHLETAHLSWSVAIVLDLAGSIFSESEREQIAQALREKGLDLCRNRLERHQHISNWHCILLAGHAVAAAVLNDEEAMAFAAGEFRKCVDFFQPDGSYGESLQYGNYAMTGLALAREALVRGKPDLAAELPLEPYVFKPRWDAASLLYQKPLSGLSTYPVPRSVNFGDSAAIYRASADNLLHIASRAKDSHPEMAGLARWLFDTLYLPCVESLPHDRASFGFINDFNFLTLVLLPQAAEAIPPEKAGVTTLETFSAGNVITRNAFDGKTVLAARTGSEALHAAAHLHGDLNSFILTHNNERLLADAGHSCYRNLIHEIETASLTHNTCTFAVNADDSLGLQEDQHRQQRLQQSTSGRRHFDAHGENGATIDRGARLLLAEKVGNVTVIASEASKVYGAPLTDFTRVWLLCGEHVLFVVDLVQAKRPVKPSWSWLLNNRDGALGLKVIMPDRLVARRGNAGMKLFHLGDGRLIGPSYAHIHDAYHPLPNQSTEGKPGSGLLLRWDARQAEESSVTAHAICLDTPGRIASWHLKQEEGYAAVIEDPSHQCHWKLKLGSDPTTVIVEESHTHKITELCRKKAEWTLKQS